MNSKAITLALSGKLRDGEMTIIDKLELAEKKTKKMAEAMKNLKIKGTILISFTDAEKNLRQFSRNLPAAQNILTSQLNVFDILNRKNLIFSKESVKYLEDKYGKDKGTK